LTAHDPRTTAATTAAILEMEATTGMALLQNEDTAPGRVVLTVTVSSRARETETVKRMMRMIMKSTNLNPTIQMMIGTGASWKAGC